MASLTEMLEESEAALGRQLTDYEQLFVARMHKAQKDVAYCIEVLSEPEDPEPSDEELITTRYEATVGGPQDITGIWG